MARNDGGPAFPVEKQVQKMSDGTRIEVVIGHTGMDLRDWFAGQAIRLAGRDGMEECLQPGQLFRLATDAYALADSMLKARDGP
jgi:hypothetical protein